MRPVIKLDRKSAESLMIELLNETIKPPEEPYNSNYAREKLARIRQAIKILELYILHQEHQDVLSRVEEVEQLIISIDDVTLDIRTELQREREATY